MSEQIDIAVDLGVVAPQLPDMVSLREFSSVPCPPPPQIGRSLLHKGCKMILGDILVPS